MDLDDCVTMIDDLQSVLEERRLDGDERLELDEFDRSIKQLPPRVVGKVGEDELMGLRHEVVLVELVAYILWGVLQIRTESTRSASVKVCSHGA